MSAEVLRILDANGNRAREALRVMEEYARFVLDDSALTEALKQGRHELAALERVFTTVAGIASVREMAPEPAAEPKSPAARVGDGADLLAHRRIVGDVGREIGTASEYQRADSGAVVDAAGRRLNEALRVLEEYGKVVDSDAARRAERMRYLSYEWQQRLLLTARAQRRWANVRLYVLITESLCHGGWLETAAAVLRGGADALQLREKNLSDAVLLQRARQLATVCHEYSALCVINDRPDIARLAGADGVHLGQDDMDVASARRVLGARGIVGVSTHTIDQAQAAVQTVPDYVAVGPMFPSGTKPQEQIAGVSTLEAVRRVTGLPLVAIGGVGPDNAHEVLERANCTLCVCQAVIATPDPESASRRVRSVTDRHVDGAGLS